MFSSIWVGCSRGFRWGLVRAGPAVVRSFTGCDRLGVPAGVCGEWRREVDRRRLCVWCSVSGPIAGIFWGAGVRMQARNGEGVDRFRFAFRLGEMASVTAIVWWCGAGSDSPFRVPMGLRVSAFDGHAASKDHGVCVHKMTGSAGADSRHLLPNGGCWRGKRFRPRRMRQGGDRSYA